MDLRIKVFADSADLSAMATASAHPLVRGFTTNPTLMRNAGVRNYMAFAKDVLAIVGERSVSFEVIADDITTMERQAHEIASWGDNVYVKIPITNTKGAWTSQLVWRLSRAGIKVNVTAIMTAEQFVTAVHHLSGLGTPAVLSVFAGRIADTGRDPVPIMREYARLLTEADTSHIELLWASPREALNVYQANAVGCHIITVTDDILRKLKLNGKDLAEFSLNTVRMFYDDARDASLVLNVEDTKRPGDGRGRIRRPRSGAAAAS